MFVRRGSRSTRSPSHLAGGISVGVDRMQRNFEPMREQAELCSLSDLRRTSHYCIRA
jgi:hypothetical protein